MLNLPEALEFEQYSIDTSLIEVRKLLEQTPKTGKARDFYSTIESALIALHFSMLQSQTMRKAYDKMCNRLDNVEKLMAKMVDDK